MDDFIIKENCDMCGKSLRGGRIMSMYNTQCICIECKKKEMKRANYEDAAKTECEEVKKAITTTRVSKKKNKTENNHKEKLSNEGFFSCSNISRR